jgi:3-oxoacyl-[acyl-carrier protein] reductase
MTPFARFEPGCLAGQVALVTGAGGGIGSAVAARMAGMGVRLVLADLRPAAVSRAAASLQGADTMIWAGDLADEAAAQELFEQVASRFGRVDAVVNAAGVVRATPLLELTKAEWDAVMDANAGTAFLVCREACRLMREQRSGAIVNFSSLAAQLGGVVAGAHYAASKAAVISLTRSVAKVMAPYGVRCNALAPSGVETEMLDTFTEEQRETLVRGIPLGRFGTAEEIAELVVWLCSPASAWITGQTIHVNGGAFFG